MFSFNTKKTVGLDISDNSAEVVCLEAVKDDFRVYSKNKISLPEGIVVLGKIKDNVKLAKYLVQLFQSAKPSIVLEDVVFGLPESQVYSHVITIFPYENYREVIFQKIKENVPLPEEDVVYAIKLIPGKNLNQEKEYQQYLVFATSRRLLNEWMQFFAKINLNVKVFDFECLATFRGLYLHDLARPICLADIGAHSSKVYIFNGQGLKYSFVFRNAGQTITANLARILKISLQAAEEKKKNVDLTSKAKNELQAAVLQSLEPIAAEIKQTIDYFNKQHDEKIEKIILTGGTSNLKGFVKYASDKLGLPAELGASALVGKKDSQEFLEATGLALRALDKKYMAQDPYLAAETALSFTVLKKERYQNQKPIFQKEPRTITKMIGERNLKARRGFLIAVIILEVFALFGAFWYRNYLDDQHQQLLNEVGGYIFDNKVLQSKFMVKVGETSAGENVVRARIVEDKAAKTEDYQGMISESYKKTAALLRPEEGMIVWQFPVDVLIGQEPTAGKSYYTVKWLIFSQADVRKLSYKDVVGALSKTKGTLQLVDNINYLKLLPTEQPNAYYLLVDINYSVQQP